MCISTGFKLLLSERSLEGFGNTLIARFMGPTRGPPGANMAQWAQLGHMKIAICDSLPGVEAKLFLENLATQCWYRHSE